MGFTSSLRVRATSVLCLLGLGLGIGSLLVYRFCTRLFTAQPKPPSSSSSQKQRKRPLQHDNETSCFTSLPVVNTVTAPDNTDGDSVQPSPEGTIDSGISTSSSTNAMGNLSSSPDCPSHPVFYSPVEGVRFRGPPGPDGNHRPRGGSEDSDGFVHVTQIQAPPRLLHQQDDAESGVSLLGSSPESQEIHNYFSSRQKHVPPLHIDIPHGHNKLMDAAASAVSHITDPDDLDAGLGFSPLSSLDNASLSGHSMKANFSPVSLSERNLRMEPNDSFSELDRSGGRKAPLGSRGRKHSTPLSECSRSFSSSTSIPEDLKSVENKGDEEPSGVVPSHSSYSLGFGESFDQSSISESRSQSIDFSDSLSGIATPDGELFSPMDLGSRTQLGMETLETDLKDVQAEISEISDKIQKMCQNIAIPSAVALGPDYPNCASPKSPEVQKAFSVLYKHKSNSSTASPVRDESVSESFSQDQSDSSKSNRTFTQSGEFMWDCRSDVNAAQIPDRRKLLSHWATVDANSDNSSASPSTVASSSGSSPSHGAVKSHFTRSNHSASINSFADLTPDSSRHGSVSVNDLYIDDGFSDLASRTDSSGRVSLDSGSLKSGSFPSSIASSTHTSPRHISPHDGANSPVVAAADVQNNTQGADSSNNNNAADNANSTKEDLPDCDSSQDMCASSDISSTLTLDLQQASLDANKNPTVMSSAETTSNIVTLNIGPKVELSKYVEREWKGTTNTAKTMKQGYDSIPNLLHKSHIRRVRGDNYCAIRGVLFQCLVNEVDINNNICQHIDISKDLQIFDSKLHSFLNKWSFGGRVGVSSGQVYPVIKHFIDCLFRQVNGVRQLSGTSCKEELISALLNNKQNVDLQLMEATKALMMVTAVKLFEDYRADRPVPVFVWLMFARDTSLDPKSFFENHLNPVGDSGGLEQVEMFLLAHTLGINIEVVRPSQFGSDDFITQFQDDTDVTSLPKVLLIAEDDRHYNVLV